MSQSRLTESDYGSERTTIEMAKANGYRQAMMDMVGMMEESNVPAETRRKIFDAMVSKSMRIELPQNVNLYDKL